MCPALIKFNGPVGKNQEQNFKDSWRVPSVGTLFQGSQLACEVFFVKSMKSFFDFNLSNTIECLLISQQTVDMMTDWTNRMWQQFAAQSL